MKLHSSPSSRNYPRTPDGRYFVVRGRLWRTTNPNLHEHDRERHVRDLMAARRAVRAAKQDPPAPQLARAAVDTAKVALGERGPVWWTDGAPDFNRQMVAATPYADWYGTLANPVTPAGSVATKG